MIIQHLAGNQPWWEVHASLQSSIHLFENRFQYPISSITFPTTMIYQWNLVYNSTQRKSWSWSLTQRVLATVPTHENSYVSGLGPEPKHWNRFHDMKACTVAIGPGLPPKYRHFNLTMLARFKYLSSDCIVTWSIWRLSSFSCFFTSRLQICNLTNIHGVAIENP